MSDYWDSVDDARSGKADDLKAYLEERRRRAAQYVRTAKRAQEKIDKLRKLEAQRRQALGKD